MFTKVKTKNEITAMRHSGRLLATVLDVLCGAIEPGMTTQDLAELAKRELRGTGGQPTFLGYQGFPSVICISVNDEVVHGIPGDKVIENGDIVSLDYGVTYDGMITDSAISVIVGSPISSAEKKLLRDTRSSLQAGIDQIIDGVKVGTIANAIEDQLKDTYGIVRDLVGHGVGHQLHEEPNIPNYGKPDTGPILHAGMTIAVEPMATMGRHEVIVDRDGWTVRTRDGSRAAHFEHTILITEDGSEILTSL